MTENGCRTWRQTLADIAVCLAVMCALNVWVTFSEVRPGREAYRPYLFAALMGGPLGPFFDGRHPTPHWPRSDLLVFWPFVMGPITLVGFGIITPSRAALAWGFVSWFVLGYLFSVAVWI